MGLERKLPGLRRIVKARRISDEELPVRALAGELVKLSENYDRTVWFGVLQMLIVYEWHETGASKEQFLKTMENTWDDFSKPKTHD